jgi:outer membrane lipoprotein-sorting protein
MNLPRLVSLVLVALSVSITAPAQQSKLDAVLTQMDEASQRFKSATADFSWDQYQKVVDEHDIQTGKIYFRRNSRETQMAADIEKPVAKKVVFSGGKVLFYQPQINQITEKDTGSNREAVESFLVLGFGGRGHDLLTTYDVTYTGNEQINGTDTAKLELIPKAESVRRMFNKIIIWVDPKQDISLKQQAFEPSGDYRIATYTAIKLNVRVPDDVFKIKSDSNTKVVK